MSSLTVPIPPDLSPACRAGNTDLGTAPIQGAEKEGASMSAAIEEIEIGLSNEEFERYQNSPSLGTTSARARSGASSPGRS